MTGLECPSPGTLVFQRTLWPVAGSQSVGGFWPSATPEASRTRGRTATGTGRRRPGRPPPSARDTRPQTPGRPADAPSDRPSYPGRGTKGTPQVPPARLGRHDADLPVPGTTTSNTCCGIASVSCIGTLSRKKITTRSSRRSGRAGRWLRHFDPGLDNLHPGALEVLLIAGHDRQSMVQSHRRDQPVHRGETGAGAP